MSNRHTLTPLAAVTLSLFSAGAMANNFAVDGRGNGMGGTGVVSASYLTAPFYNPALGTIYRQNDDVGMILPGIGLGYTNQDGILDDIDTLVEALEPAVPDENEVSDALDALSGDNVRTELGLVAAFAIPNPMISTNLFLKGYSDSYAAPIIPDIDDVVDRAEASSVQAVSIGVAEVGVNFAKYANIFGHHFSFGVAPKYQQIYTYVDSSSLEAFDSVTDLKGEMTSEGGINLDAGALWFYGPLRVGLSGKNLIKKEIETARYQETVGTYTYDVGYDYELTPVYTIGAGYVDNYFTFSVDYDLNKDKRFDTFDDDVQMLRVGTEVDLARQLQLRLGYKTNVLNDEDAYTAGVGLSPFGLFHLDASVNYKSKENFGLYANFLVYY